MAAGLSPEEQGRADILSNWLGQQQVDYAQPAQLQAILLNLVGEVQRLQRDKDTSKGARKIIESLVGAISFYGNGDAVKAALAIEDLNHVAMNLVSTLDLQSYLQPTDSRALLKRIQEVREKLQVVAGQQVQGVPQQNVNTQANAAPSAPELHALQNIEIKLENLVEKGKQVGPAIDIAIVSASVRAPYLFNYTERGQAKTQTYPTLYDLAAEVVGYENDADYKQLLQVAAGQKPTLLANPLIDSAKKWGGEIEKLKNETLKKVDLIFQADQVALDVVSARAALSGPTIKFDGSLNLLAQVNTLEAAIATMKLASFPAGAALRDAELNLSEPLLKQAKLSEWLRNLSSTSPNLFTLLDRVKRYPQNWPSTFKEQAKELNDLLAQAIVEITWLVGDEARYYDTELVKNIDKLRETIDKERAAEAENASGDKGQYLAEKALLESIVDDWDLVEYTLTGPAKVRFEEHGGINMDTPLEKAAYDVLSARMFISPELKRQENGYGPLDVGGNEKFDKWLLARGRMSLRAFKRKMVDSGAARSNVGLWKVEPNDSASEHVMFGYLLNRGPLILETYKHPVIGPFLTELMERMLAQGSLRKGVIAVRNPADNRYYARRLRPTDPQPTQADLDSGRVLLPDSQFNYDKMHQTSDGIDKYLTNKVKELIAKLQPQFNLDPFYLKALQETAINLFCDFNYVDILSSSAQERTQTPTAPRTKLVSAIEAVQNLGANVLHTLLRYRADRKSQLWFAHMIDFEPHLDAIGPHVGATDAEHAEDIGLLREVIHGLTEFYQIHFNTSVFKRAGTPDRLGKVKMAALGHSQGVSNMYETLSEVLPGETVTRDSIEIKYDYDKYMSTLAAWSKFLDSIIQEFPAEMSFDDVEKSSDHGGIIDTAITKTLAIAKLAPGTHYDLVPIMLYEMSQRILLRFTDDQERKQVLKYMKTRFEDACKPGQGLDAFAVQMRPFLKMFGVGQLTATDRRELTYGGYHQDFAPVKDYDQRIHVYNFLVSEWRKKHPGVNPPAVAPGYRRPDYVDWSIYRLAVGDLTKSAEKFYEQLEHLEPEAPADRVGLKDNLK